MKRKNWLPFIVLIIFFGSCKKDDEKVNSPQTTQHCLQFLSDVNQQPVAGVNVSVEISSTGNVDTIFGTTGLDGKLCITLQNNETISDVITDHPDYAVFCNQFGVPSNEIFMLTPYSWVKVHAINNAPVLSSEKFQITYPYYFCDLLDQSDAFMIPDTTFIKKTLSGNHPFEWKYLVNSLAVYDSTSNFYYPPGDTLELQFTY